MKQLSQNPKKEKRIPDWFIVTFFVGMAIILIYGLIFFYNQQSERIVEQKTKELESIAELKVDQISQWREELFNNIDVYTSELFFKQLFDENEANFVKNSDFELMQAQFKELSLRKGYKNILITTIDGEIIFSTSKTVSTLGDETIKLINEVITSEDIILGDFYKGHSENEINLELAAPILNENNETILVLVIQIDPNQHLFPIIQTWPTHSESAETLIIRRDNDNVQFLNTLKHDPSPPLSISIPLTKTEVPAVQAIMGRTGSFSGLDYRGVEVLSEIHPIPDTNWYMIAKEDKTEILAEQISLARYITLMIVFSIILTISLAAYIFSYRQRNLYFGLLQAEQVKIKAEEETRTTLYSIGDGVITTDAQGLITRMNPIATHLTGWDEKEAVGKPLPEIFHIIKEQTGEIVESPVDQVLKKGIIVGLTNHTILISKDGTERPIADSGAPIRNTEGEISGVVLVFRDQTEERELQKEKALLYDTLSASLDEIYIFDAETQVFRFANTGALKNLGYTLPELLKLTPFDLKPHFTPAQFQELIIPLRDKSKEMVIFSTIHQRKNGTHYPVEVHLQLFSNENEEVFLAVIQDITEKLAQEEKVRKSEEQYTQLFNEMKEGFALHEIILDDKGNPIDYQYLDVNPAFEQQTGLNKEDILNKTIREIAPTIEDYWIKTYGEVALEGKSIKFENYTAPFDKWFSVSSFSPNEKQFATISIDITEQKKSAKAIMESEERFRSLFENMAQGVVYHNADGEVILTNDAAKRILGFSQADIIGKTSQSSQWQSIHEDGSEFSGNMHPAVLAQKTGKIINNVVMGVYNPIRQQYIWININAVPQYHIDESEPYQVFVTFEDITAQKNAEDTLKHQLDELRRWNEVVLGREGRILELKQEINELLEKLGKTPKYTSAMKGE